MQYQQVETLAKYQRIKDHKYYDEFMIKIKD